MRTAQYWAKHYAKWLTDDRMERWNALRLKAGVDEITREIGANYLSRFERGDSFAKEVLRQIKERIG